jgi:hypothetical protein
MSELVVPVVERLRVKAVQPVHSRRQIRFRRRDEEVVMRAHQAVRLDRPLEPPDDVVEAELEVAPVVVRDKDAPAESRTRHHVIGHSGRLVARLPRHATTVGGTAACQA